MNIKKITAILCSSTLLFGMCTPAYASTSDEIQVNIIQLSNQMLNLESDILKIKDEEKETAQEKDDLDSNIEKAEEKINYHEETLLKEEDEYRAKTQIGAVLKVLSQSGNVFNVLQEVRDQKDDEEQVLKLIDEYEEDIENFKENLQTAERDLSSLYELEQEKISEKDEINEELTQKKAEYKNAMEQETKEEEEKKAEEEAERQAKEEAEKEAEEKAKEEAQEDTQEDIQDNGQQTITTTTYYTYENSDGQDVKDEATDDTLAENGWREGENFDSASFYAKFGYVDSGYPLNRTNGVVYYNGHKETYYSERILPGGGLNIPGRHTDEQGLVRDGDGYICVASSDLAKGTTIQTSLGLAKVYDSGCASGTIDIYTNW